MKNEQLFVKRDSGNKKLDDKYLEYLAESISKYNTNEFNSVMPKKSSCELLVKNLTNSHYLELSNSNSLSQRIWKSLSTFTVLPETTVNDYLANTTLSISANKSIASDWKKVGDQLRLSCLKQPEVKG